MSSWWQERSHGSGGWAGHSWGSGAEGGHQSWGNHTWDGDNWGKDGWGSGDWTAASHGHSAPYESQEDSHKRSAPTESREDSHKRGAPSESREDSRVLRRRTTDEGRTYEAYTYLGGESKASLPLPDRCKLVHAMLDGAVGALTLNTMSGAQIPSTPP